MVVGWHRATAGAKQTDLLALEALIGTELPADYRDFLREHDGGEPAPNTFAIPGTSNEAGVNEFMGVSQIREELRALGERLPPGTIPIAVAEGGNLLLLGLADGRVSFWDHELEHAEPVFSVAASFRAFWDALEPFDPSTIDLKPGQVKSVWVDPDLLK
jgi:hypothetical protein